MNLAELIKASKTAELRCRKILEDCENPEVDFPRFTEDYNFAARLYRLFSTENESFPQKAYENTLIAIKGGYHTTSNLSYVAEYLYDNKNTIGLKQLSALVVDKRFCYRYTPGSARLINDILELKRKLISECPQNGCLLLTAQELEDIFEICVRHRKTIERYQLVSKMEQDGMRNGYVGVRDARRELYSLDYTGINISYHVSPTYYDDLISALLFARKSGK